MIESLEVYMRVRGRRREKLGIIIREWEGVRVEELWEGSDYKYVVRIPDADGELEVYEINEAVYETALYIEASKRWFMFLARHNHAAAANFEPPL